MKKDALGFTLVNFSKLIHIGTNLLDEPFVLHPKFSKYSIFKIYCNQIDTLLLEQNLEMRMRWVIIFYLNKVMNIMCKMMRCWMLIIMALNILAG